MRSDSEEGEGGEVGEDEYDALYDKAVELIIDKQHASTSLVQRVFRIGYNRAARIIERMEKEGIVSAMDGARPREVLVRQNPGDEIN
jgi:S-DNA-T family DNA segregation ATPase FtsK/SpoIIIE